VAALPAKSGFLLPAAIADAGDHAAKRFFEFFTATIRNPHTRKAYARAAALRGCVGRSDPTRAASGPLKWLQPDPFARPGPDPQERGHGEADWLVGHPVERHQVARPGRVLDGERIPGNAGELPQRLDDYSHGKSFEFSSAGCA
jgi:hypothetical protein